jgi:hypothetical protein
MELQLHEAEDPLSGKRNLIRRQEFELARTADKSGLHQFFEQKYVVLKSLLGQNSARLLYDYVVELANKGNCKRDRNVANALALYAGPCMENLLLQLLPIIEEVSDLKLFPTYSYFRVYKRGGVLAKHYDRPACEISVSLTLGYNADAAWPLWIEGPSGTCAAELERGDALVYRGCECAHWRKTFPGEHHAQVFLHCVDQSGGNREWKFNKRRMLSLSMPAELDPVETGAVHKSSANYSRAALISWLASRIANDSPISHGTALKTSKALSRRASAPGT